ncbi:BTAD domain-containing putative transcriptional regulator [Streptomyces sp. NPDC002851]
MLGAGGWSGRSTRGPYASDDRAGSAAPGAGRPVGDLPVIRLVRAESLMREGKAALASGDPRAASQPLRRALTQWRGDPYADADATSTVVQRANELESLKAESIQAHIDADLGG